MDHIGLRKKIIRKECLNRRDRMSLDEVTVKSESIVNQMLLLNEYKRGKVIYCYFPLGNEVNILPLVEDALKKGKIVCFPRVISNTIMKFYQVQSLDEFKLGKFNVMEPTSTIEINRYEKAFMVVPGLAFDDKNYRIGYGGGYYDRYITPILADHKDLYTCGVCYSWQKKDDLPINIYDKKLNRIIVEQ